MSSYELLELLEFMPEEGAFKTAARDGEYCERDMVWRHVANELSKLRATMHAVHGGQGYEPQIFPTLAEVREAIEKDEAVTARREEFYKLADRDPDTLAIGG